MPAIFQPGYHHLLLGSWQLAFCLLHIYLFQLLPTVDHFNKTDLCYPTSNSCLLPVGWNPTGLTWSQGLLGFHWLGLSCRINSCSPFFLQYSHTQQSLVVLDLGYCPWPCCLSPPPWNILSPLLCLVHFVFTSTQEAISSSHSPQP